MKRSLVLGVLVVSLFAFDAFAAAVVRSGAGLAAATAARDQFRADLGGGTVAGANGSFGGVRREINWDGVPDSFSAPNNLPANFFNVNSPRGVVFSTPGTGFQVSATAASGTPVRFGNINATYPATFVAFSPERLFTSLGSNVMDVNFFVPGTTVPATVTGFGAIFTDVDNASVTTIQYFDALGASLGTFNVPVASGDVSFLGVSFNAGERVSRVRITSGNAALGPNDAPPATDVAVMDDFLYSEPGANSAAIPAASTLVLLVLGTVLVAIAALRLRF
jgi:hypothetical protein